MYVHDVEITKRYKNVFKYNFRCSNYYNIALAGK